FADVKILALRWRARLRHLGVEHHADRFGRGMHGERDAKVADHRTDDIAVPRAISGPEGVASPEPERGGIDRFLSERSKTLPLKRHVSKPNFAARKKRLETIVDRPRQHHA